MNEKGMNEKRKIGVCACVTLTPEPEASKLNKLSSCCLLWLYKSPMQIVAQRVTYRYI